MSFFKFRIRFQLAPTCRLLYDHGRVKFDLGEPLGVVELIGRSEDKCISGSSELILRSAHGFADELSATEAGVLATKALMIAATSLRFGIDLGKGGSKGFITPYGRAWLAKQMGFDGQIVNDAPGLMVYEAEAETRFAKLDAGRVAVGRPIEEFLRKIQDSSNAASKLDEKLVLAFEIYNASQFERSLRARFLSLVTVVEVLSTRQQRSDAAVGLVSSFIHSVKTSDLKPDDKAPLASALRDLKLQSIASACREIVSRYEGAEAASLFKDWYKSRSELVHAGETGLNLRSTIDQVDQLVSRVLVASAGEAGTA